VSGEPTYSFLPWLRSGVANSITSADGDGAVQLRASMPLDVTLTGTKLDGSADTQTVHRDVSLYGPGDILGIESKAVVKTDPANWITNFEPNYLPYIDFYDEDFPWRYTPAAADKAKHRLRPWITLVVLEDGPDAEFEDGKDMSGHPLPYFNLAAGTKATDLFPKSDELWAWAHVHVNQDLSNAGDDAIDGALTKLRAAIAANPDLAYSRLMCPRRLKPDTPYRAFVIPSFESGRLAGLGLDVPAATVATKGAWDDGQTTFPTYYSWYFHTSDFGDFEYLVRLLVPKPVDPKVGVRDIDVLHIDTLPGIDKPELGGVLKLGGALRVPFDSLTPDDQIIAKRYDAWDDPYPDTFETALAARINLADDYARLEAKDANPDNDPDPIVTSPLYGRWPAKVNRVLTAADGTQAANDTNWIHRLNLDPRYRVAAGLGTGVVQQNDQKYMAAAWQQVGDIISANARLRFAQMAQASAFSLYDRHIVSLNQERQFVLTAPVHARVMGSPTTVAAQLRASVVPAAVVSGAFRRATRQATPLMHRLALGAAAPSQMVTKINAGTLVPAPPKDAPGGATQIKDAVGAVEPAAPLLPAALTAAVKTNNNLKYAPLLLILVALLLFPFVSLLVFIIALVLLGGAGAAATVALNNFAKTGSLADTIREEQQTPQSVDAIPKVGNFRITTPDEQFTPVPGPTDSDEGVKFKTGLRDVYVYTSAQYPEPPRGPLDLPGLTKKVVDALDPAYTIPRRVRQVLHLPGRITGDMVETFAPVMAYPVFDVPMYKPLSDLSAELFLPNLSLIPNNSMTLLETNQSFIEAYMVGLNHEMARELLWNEYPTDQRGSYFRQFWDVSLQLPPRPSDADKEKLRDIPELHKWKLDTALGSHDARAAKGAKALLVLAIRGELLKRYPTAVIYAQRAQWQKKGDGTPDYGKDRILVEPTAAEAASPPPDKIQLPLFEAKVDPDIYFIGFNLKADEVKGAADGDAGWFFVIKERPGEPRFGMDDVAGTAKPPLINWNDLAWNDIAAAPGDLIKLDKTLSLTTVGSKPGDEPMADDAQATWSPNTDAAELAYILYRVPVLVAVHASRMLP
jgi:hypothetical protein